MDINKAFADIILRTLLILYFRRFKKSIIRFVVFNSAIDIEPISGASIIQ